MPPLLSVLQTLWRFCLYPKTRIGADEVIAAAALYAPFIARLYFATIERAAMNLRRKTVDHVAYRGDIGSLTYNFLTLARAELSVEGAALWVLDARRQLLYRRKALNPRAPQQPGTFPALPLTHSSLVADCFRTGCAVRHDPAHQVLDPSAVDLALASPLHNWTAMPITLPPEAKLRGRNPGQPVFWN